MNSTTDLIGAVEAARILGVSRQTIWRDTRSGELVPVMDVGTIMRPSYRYSRQYIDLKARSAESAESAAQNEPISSKGE